MSKGSASSSKTAIKRYSWTGLVQEQLTDRVLRRTFSGEQLTVAEFTFGAGEIVALHAHPNEQVTWVLEGALRIWVGESAKSKSSSDFIVVSAGDLIVIPVNAPHRAEALMDTVSIDIFAPPRQDWIEGTGDTYLRGR